jgi:ferritin-like protein
LKQLGSSPIAKLTDLIDHATDKPFKLPEEADDLSGLLAAVLDAERTSLRTFHALCELAANDPVTAALALDLLHEAMDGEQEMETLLGSTAPELDGT